MIEALDIKPQIGQSENDISINLFSYKPGRVLGSRVDLTPFSCLDVDKVFFHHVAKDVGGKSCFFCQLLDGRYVFIEDLNYQGYCLVDNSLTRMIRYGIPADIRDMYELSYENIESEEIILIWP